MEKPKKRANHCASSFVHFLSGPIWNCSTCFPEYGSNWDLIQKQTHLEPFKAVPWKREAYPHQKFQGSNWNLSLFNAILFPIFSKC